MKKLVFVIFLFLLLNSCSQFNVRNFGKEITVELPTGMKLVEVTWKENNLWYLVEPMDSSYVPKTKLFIEKSNAGMMEGKVTFKEIR